MQNNENSIEYYLYQKHIDYIWSFETEKFRNRYPELFNEQFVLFCKDEIIPVFRNAKNKYVKYSIYDLEKKNWFLAIITGIVMIGSLLLDVFLLIYLFGIFKNILIQILLILLITVITAFSWLIITMPYANRVFLKYKEQWANVKKEVFPIICSKIPNCKYLTEYSIGYKMLQYLKNTKLIKERKLVNFSFEEDRFQIEYNGHLIDIGEYCFGGIDKYDYPLARFKNQTYAGSGYGLFVRMKIETKIKGKTVILRKLFKRDNLANTKESIILENDEFNKIFSVIASSQLEARKVLTPKFMQFLIDFSEEYPNNEFDVSIENGYFNFVFIKMGEYESFEFKPSKLHNWNDIIRDSRAMIIEINEILRMIDAFEID